MLFQEFEHEAFYYGKGSAVMKVGDILETMVGSEPHYLKVARNPTTDLIHLIDGATHEVRDISPSDREFFDQECYAPMNPNSIPSFPEY
ncbi:MAG: hypothetical protein WCO52_03620 [bacterium]